MEIRQTLNENSNKMESNFGEIAELKLGMVAKEKELKDLHELVGLCMRVARACI